MSSLCSGWRIKVIVTSLSLLVIVVIVVSGGGCTAGLKSEDVIIEENDISAHVRRRYTIEAMEFKNALAMS